MGLRANVAPQHAEGRGWVMTPQRWARLKRAFASAVAAPPRARPGVLDRACGRDAQLRRAADNLIRAHAQTDDLFDHPPIAMNDAGLAARLIVEMYESAWA